MVPSQYFASGSIEWKLFTIPLQAAIAAIFMANVGLYTSSNEEQLVYKNTALTMTHLWC
jgi:hypothetical protein